MNGGKISLTNKLTRDSRTSLSIAKGYKQGGFNLGTGFNNSNLVRAISFSPEYLTNYEFGFNRYFKSQETYID